jgi:hypothetical protein
MRHSRLRAFFGLNHIAISAVNLLMMRSCKSFRRARIQASLAAISLVVLTISVNARAFIKMLEAEDIDKAYSIGQSTDRGEVAAFLRQYQKTFKYPSGKPLAYIKFVEFETPYEQIVLKAQNTPGYTSLRAADEYLANTGVVIVRVIVSLKNNYGGPKPPDDSYNVVISQSNLIEPRKVSSTEPCNPFNVVATSTVGDCVGYTREIDLTFGVEQFQPGSVKIKVTLPESPSMETTFDLEKLM